MIAKTVWQAAEEAPAKAVNHVGNGVRSGLGVVEGIQIRGQVLPTWCDGA